MRAVREAAGIRQQDLSDAAKRLGLATWTRTRIAALERGDKAISAEDLVRLLAVLNLSARRRVDAAELFDASDTIALSDTAWIPARGVAEVLCGGDTTDHVVTLYQPSPSSVDTPERRRAADRASRILHAAGRTALPTVGETRAVSLGMGEADERAARDLGLDLYPFETLCLVLWGRSLSAERDARMDASRPREGTAERGCTPGPADTQLLAEARTRLIEIEGTADGEHRETP